MWLIVIQAMIITTPGSGNKVTLVDWNISKCKSILYISKKQQLLISLSINKLYVGVSSAASISQLAASDIGASHRGPAGG